MVKFLKKCEVCRGKKFPEDKEHHSFLIKKIYYETVHAGTICSQKLICGRCAKNTRTMLGDEIKK